MATAAAPRNDDVYLSILAGRVLTALADLAADSSAWSERIEKDLESGVEYCQTLRVCRSAPSRARGGEQQDLRHLATQTDDGRDSPARRLDSDCKEVEALLLGLLARSHKPESEELLAAIKFFVKDVGSQGS
jgi:hypothetical protein